MVEERCERYDLPVSMCACPQHRGGRTVEEEAAAERVTVVTGGSWFPAKFAGVCAGCGDFFPVNANIHRVPPESGTGYVAECCAEDVA